MPWWRPPSPWRPRSRCHWRMKMMRRRRRRAAAGGSSAPGPSWSPPCSPLTGRKAENIIVYHNFWSMIMSGPGLINMKLSKLSLVLNTNIISLYHIFHVKWKKLTAMKCPFFLQLVKNILIFLACSTCPNIHPCSWNINVIIKRTTITENSSLLFRSSCESRSDIRSRLSSVSSLHKYF